MTICTLTRHLATLAMACLLSLPATAQDVPQANTIRTNLAKQLPNLPAIDSVLATPMKGLFEVRFGGSDILYTDAG
ncbi:MAG: disulfide isomerase DsbC N-terminal domain-containing protein, partial [Burkholderiaceae bacterium]